MVMAEPNPMQSPESLRRLCPPDAGQYRDVMIEAYGLHPDAFTSSVSERAVLPLTRWEARLQQTPAAGEVFFGAWDEGVLVGVVGLAFEAREKVRHKATLIGMYVKSAYRGTGLGGQLVSMALQFLGGRPEVTVIQLTVTEGNTAAQALYERFGFVSFGTEPMAVAVAGRYVSKVHMWRLLEPPKLSSHDGG